MPIIDFQTLVNQTLTEDLLEQADWQEWRDCYDAGDRFRELYLKKFSDREDNTEFIRRRDLTPIPAYAKREINRVKNSISQRLPDITRRGGSKKWRDAVAGIGRGVDRRGSSMNSFISKALLADLLVMGRVGVLVDAPKVIGSTMADVPTDFRPYLNGYPIERVPIRIPAPVDSPSDWLAVLLVDEATTIDPTNGVQVDVKTFRYYYLDPTRDNLVTVQVLDSVGKEIDGPILTELESIPFVMFDIGGSLIKDVCSHQVVLLNMISSDSNYAIDSNYSFMVRQRGNSNAGAYLIGDEQEATVGVRKGLFYDKGLNAPAFISP
ncbi:MAG: hypothetical protein MN733_10975, partial [Nitrososphaera sp.]|nr:hypothetical protein [Nitrososphaera sp.]